MLTISHANNHTNSKQDTDSHANSELYPAYFANIQWNSDAEPFINAKPVTIHTRDVQSGQFLVFRAGAVHPVCSRNVFGHYERTKVRALPCRDLRCKSGPFERCVLGCMRFVCSR